jgi:hypothetical protein
MATNSNRPLGTTADTAATNTTDGWSVVSLLKAIFGKLGGTGSSAPQTQGTAADGAAASGNPVQVAGKDDSANIQTIHTDTSGDVQVDLASALPAGENHVGEVGGRTTSVEVTLTRPADTTAYSVNDAVTNATSSASAIEFASAVRVSAGSGVIVNWMLTKSTTTTTNATFRLWLYKSSPSSVPNDNAAFSQLWANRSARIGYVDFTTAIAGSDCVDYFGVPVFTQQIVKLGSGTSLYGILQALGAYAPGNAEQFLFKVGVLQD